MSDVTYEVDSDGVAVVTWDLENRSMNVLNFQSLGEYRQIIEKLIGDDAVKGIVLRSAKDAFIAGADLTSSEVFGFDSVQEDKVKAAEKIYNGNMEMQLLFRSMETCGKPFVAAINGHALGGGFEICLSCHYRVAIDNDKIQIGQPEAKVGLIPGAGGTQRLPRIIGLPLAKEMIFTGQKLSGYECLEIGLVNHTEDDHEKAMEKAMEIATIIGAEKGPVAIRAAKQAINYGINMDISSACKLKRLATRKLCPLKIELKG